MTQVRIGVLAAATVVVDDALSAMARLDPRQHVMIEAAEWPGPAVQGTAQAMRPADVTRYGAAYRLLSELRVLSRRLSGGLDPVADPHAQARRSRTDLEGAELLRAEGAPDLLDAEPHDRTEQRERGEPRGEPQRPPPGGLALGGNAIDGGARRRGCGWMQREKPRDRRVASSWAFYVVPSGSQVAAPRRAAKRAACGSRFFPGRDTRSCAAANSA